MDQHSSLPHNTITIVTCVCAYRHARRWWCHSAMTALMTSLSQRLGTSGSMPRTAGRLGGWRLGPTWWTLCMGALILGTTPPQSPTLSSGGDAGLHSYLLCHLYLFFLGSSLSILFGGWTHNPSIFNFSLLHLLYVWMPTESLDNRKFIVW